MSATVIRKKGHRFFTSTTSGDIKSHAIVIDFNKALSKAGDQQTD